MQLLLKYDAYDDEYPEDQYIEVDNELDILLERIFERYEGIQFEGYLGRWDGPQAVEAKTWNINTAKRIIVNHDIFELWYADDDTDVSELQRYSEQWSMHVEKGCMLLKQWHHDGCNILALKPLGEKLNMTFAPEEVGIYGE
jgi:hypothetical protein